VQPVPAPASAPWAITSGRKSPATVDRLLRSLPEWFGIEAAIAGYVAAAADLPTYLAWPAGEAAVTADELQVVGVLLAVRHFAAAAEIYLMAVDRGMHRRGIGRALVGALEHDLRAAGARLLQVKTLGPTAPDAGYERTRKFYTSMGFEPLEEIVGFWPGNPCLIMVKTLGLSGSLTLAVRDHRELTIGGPQDAHTCSECLAEQVVA
jgi:GNAT superfamily N-acetyltransferase